MNAKTAGKGPGLVMRAENRSGALRVSVAPTKDRALLELRELDGTSTEIGLSADELRTLAKALNQMALALSSSGRDATTVRLYGYSH